MLRVRAWSRAPNRAVRPGVLRGNGGLHQRRMCLPCGHHLPALPGGDAAPDVWVIKPLSALPALSDASGGTTIDGRTQTTFGGDTNPFGPEVVLDEDVGRSAVPLGNVTYVDTAEVQHAVATLGTEWPDLRVERTEVGRQRRLAMAQRRDVTVQRPGGMRPHRPRPRGPRGVVSEASSIVGILTSGPGR